MESKVVVPVEGKKITLQNGKLNVPENPIIPFIEKWSMPPSRKPIKASVKFPGWKFTPEKNPHRFTARMSGSPLKPLI